MSHRKLQWTDEEIRTLLSLIPNDGKVSIPEITIAFNDAIKRTRTEDAVRSQLKKQAKIRSKSEKMPDASSSKLQVGEPAHQTAHGQMQPLSSEAGKFKLLHLQHPGLFDNVSPSKNSGFQFHYVKHGLLYKWLSHRCRYIVPTA
jgi:hypothetical protein